MARIIRLTESDLSRIVRRVINEDQAAQKQQLEAKITSCFGSLKIFQTKYPELSNLMVSYGLGVATVGAVCLTVAEIASGVGGIGAGFSATAALFMGAESVDKAVRAINNSDDLKREAKDFAKCITGF